MGADTSRAAAGVGIGWRQPHYARLIEDRPPLAFVEVHSENFYADGGAALAVLHQGRERYAVSLHGVGLGLGSAAGIDAWHLDRLARLVERIDPVRVSDHACFARASITGPVIHGADLLPIAFGDVSLEIIAGNVARVQDRLKRPMLVENLSAYVAFDADDARPEPEFFAALCQRTGCGLLLDVNNLYVNALNAHVADPLAAYIACTAWIDALPHGIVGEIHLAGFSDGGAIVVDDHGSRVREPVWRLYEHTLRRFGRVPTLVEWDTDVPDLDVLLGEADRAAALASATTT